MTTRAIFDDVNGDVISIKSSWRVAAGMKSKETQTDIKITDFIFEDLDTITGVQTEIIQDDVMEDEAGMTLLNYYCKVHKVEKSNESYWRNRISNGSISVDLEVSTDPDKTLDEDCILVFVDYKADAETQTEKTSNNHDDHDEKKSDSREDDHLAAFLRKVVPVLEDELATNETSKAFDGYEGVKEAASEEITLWKSLSVDLEKHKVVFPDWTKGKFYVGTITACYTNRNGERLYDVDYKDAVKLTAVREEHIRVLEEGEEAKQKRLSKKGGKRSDKKLLRLQEGVRVHVRVESGGSAGLGKYLPGRVRKVAKNGFVDVELVGGGVEVGRSQDDIIQGIDVGQPVEARRPLTVQLQCTGVCWNASGSALAVSYGRSDVTGWCDFPGAVCVWSVFSRSFQPDVPEYVLDHTSCLTCVRYHPDNPALLAAGSFNGEVVVWNLNTPEHPVGVSPIEEFSHKEAVMDVEWVYDSTHKDYQLTSVGADGKILVWSLSNGLQHPVRGATLSKGVKSSKRHYPSSHGCTAISFSGSTTARRPEFLVVGQEGGALVRGQASRILTGGALTAEVLRSKYSVDDTYVALKKGDDTFSHEAHVGPVNSIDCSPFHKRLMLTAGQDGSVKLLNMLERQPLRQWDPSPPPGTAGVSSSFGAVTCVRFSKVRPLLFAVASDEGFVYLYDIGASSSAPLTMLEAPSAQSTAAGRRVTGRAPFSGVAFNRKQRDLFAACDHSGRVYIWRLDWKLANKSTSEQSSLDALGDVQKKE